MIVNLETIVPDRLVCPDDRRRIEYVDAGNGAGAGGRTGLYLECRRSSPGEGSFYLRYKDANKKTCHIRLGTTGGGMDVQEARRLAKIRKAELTLGKDPRAVEKEKAAVPTFGMFVNEHYMPQAKVHNRGWRKKERMYELRLKKVFGDKRLDEIKRHDVSAFHLGCRSDGLSPASSDRYLALARNILNKAVEFDYLDKSPARGVKAFNPDNRVNHFLNEEELKRLVTTLNTHKNRTVSMIVLFALSTGMRIGEVLKVRWRDIDLERKLLQIPAYNAKAKRSRTVPLNQSALDLIAQSNTRDRHEYLWVNSRTNKPYTSLRHSWQKIRSEAGFPHLRLHDMRGQHASILISRGVDIFRVKELLGHAQISTTIERYSRLATGELLSASSNVADAINEAMEVETSA